MNKSLSLVLVLSVLSTMGYAQANLDAEVDAELNQMYSAKNQQPSTVTIPSESETVPAQVANTHAAVTAQPVYILNQATAQPVQTQPVNVQKQPTTLIEASPLTESRADNLRKARQDAEMSTEAKIVEKLEQSRLEDEKRRAQVLFGDKLNGGAAEAPAAQQPAAPVQPVQPQIIIVPQPVAPAAPVEKKEEAVVTPVDKEMDAALKSETTVALEPIMPEKSVQKYFSGIIGVAELDSSAVKSNYSMGFSFGNKYDDTYAVEGTFMYSKFESENTNNSYILPWGGYGVDLFDVNQYSGSVALKYFMLKGMVRPVIGGLAQYSYRDFKWSDKNGGASPRLSDANSHAFDIGAILGVEVEFSPTMRLGLDMRYIKNVAVNRNYSTGDLRYNGGFPPTQQQAYDAGYGYRTPIEELNAYIYSLSMSVSF